MIEPNAHDPCHCPVELCALNLVVRRMWHTLWRPDRVLDGFAITHSTTMPFDDDEAPMTQYGWKHHSTVHAVAMWGTN
jgi:hypothetical protein